ncbi:hypothetical protein DFH28DRAFT_1181544 [Melampsora americana]|nr:hypothetical protein DFH28DRAFT_1181544 [Melampsora americana]
MMGHTNIQHLEKRLGCLMALEESFRESHSRLSYLRRQRRRTLSEAEHAELVALPDLYEAKVGVVEHQKQWDRPGVGTTDQERYKTVMTNKQSALKQKWTTYELHVKHLEDPFWNIGHLTHPDEVWATDVATQLGIQAYRTFRSCDEELRRIAREVRNMIQDSLRVEDRLTNLKATTEMPWIPGCPNGSRPIQLIQKGGMMSERKWNESQEVLKGLHQLLLLMYCRRWMLWDMYIKSLLDRSAPHCNEPEETDVVLRDRWIALMGRIRTTWLTLLHGNPVVAEGLDEEDLEEHRFPIGDDEEGYQGNLQDVMNDVGLEWIIL